MITCPVESTLLFVFIASKSRLLVEQLKMEYDQLPEKILILFKDLQ